MPLYEYYCPSCQATFEKLRPANEADTPAACPSCEHTSPQRILSLFANSVKTNGDAMPMPVGASGGGCCGGMCGCHN